MGASHGEKDPRHPRQQLTTLLQRLERVGETGRLRIVDNSANFGPLLPDALIKRRAIVAVVNHIERRRTVSNVLTLKGVSFGHLSLLYRLML